jgi:hypothetical protein
MVDLVNDSEDEIEPPQTLLMRDVVPILISDNLDSDIKILEEKGRVDMA